MWCVGEFLLFHSRAAYGEYNSLTTCRNKNFIRVFCGMVDFLEVLRDGEILVIVFVRGGGGGEKVKHEPTKTADVH